jgi:nitroimidazol reductase NimA-like FMN-containing flavoprotein (pyridoxamine 5'-phosphate oxidase superfamily)
VNSKIKQKGDTMRRKDRLITNAETISILEKGEYGILSTVSSNNEPYGVPINYCLIDECIYFHCAIEGRKINNINSNPRVSFCVVGNTEVLPYQFGTIYESCIVQGLASESFEEEKQLALEGLIHKYSEDFVFEGLEYINKLKDKTRVFKISIESISGKARK